MSSTHKTSAGIPVNPPGYVDATEDNPGHYGKPLVLNNVFDLLVQMIEVLQRTAAAQANRLNFLSDWQKAYTDEMNQIHSFAAANGDAADTSAGEFNDATPRLAAGLSATQPSSVRAGSWDYKDGLSGTSSQAGAIRQDLNATNTTYTQEMQGNNNVISNDAKALQTNVNQTNDAVQSQTDMATSILQQLSTILTSIYQSSS